MFNCVDYLRWQNNSWEEHIDKISQHVGGTHGNTWEEHMKNFEEVLRHPSLRGKTFVPKKTFQIRKKENIFFCAGSNIFCVQVPSQPACGGTGRGEMRPVEQLSAGLGDHHHHHLNWNHHHLHHLHHHHRAQSSNYWQVLKIIITIIIIFEIIININIFVIVIKIMIISSAAACSGRSCNWGDGRGASGKVNSQCSWSSSSSLPSLSWSFVICVNKISPLFPPPGPLPGLRLLCGTEVEDARWWVFII